MKSFFSLQNVLMFLAGLIIIVLATFLTIVIFVNVDELWRLGIVQSTPGSMIFVVISMLFTNLMFWLRDMNQRIRDGHFN